ncbi:MAG TPA: hypothetical protein VK807_02600 [Gemmatimonadaceae bacterium]|jgi:hypothetical protein|nr:hypothetical protein [Gemmatimonadaceae bacterium]
MPSRALLLALPLLVSVACGPSRARPTPPPPFAGKPLDSVSTGQIVAYAQTLQFDSVMPGADTMTIQTPTGDTVHLEGEPEIGSAALADSAVTTGRIIARIHSSVAFTALGVAQGTNYFWVQGQGERARGWMIPADSLARRFVRPLLVRDHLTANFPTVRFLSIGNEGVRVFLINARCGAYCCGFTSDFTAREAPSVDSAIVEMHKRINGAP